jgi:spore germination protein KA
LKHLLLNRINLPKIENNIIGDNMNFRKNKSDSDTFCEMDCKYNMELNATNIQTILKKSSDIVVGQLSIGLNQAFSVSIIFIEGLVNRAAVSENIIKPINEGNLIKNAESEKDIINYIVHGAVYTFSQKILNNLEDALKAILNGETILVFDTSMTAISFHTTDFEKRSITEPSGENVIKGAKDSFVEALRINTATIRNRIKNPNLIFEEIVIGKQTNTNTCIVYIDGITNENLVNETRKRLKNINIDGISSSSIIEENIIDHRFSVFPQVILTERPDKLCAGLLSGQVGVIVDGLPLAFWIPGTFIQLFQASEDYSQNYLISSLLRFLRFLLLGATLLIPSFYIAITTFHTEMIPSTLVFSISKSKEGVPFPTFVEVIIMLLIFEILIEAAVRLPKTIGQTISIVGSIIIGQSTVEAKLVSPIIIIVISLTAISGFAIPNADLSNALRLWRVGFVILSTMAGLFGLSIGIIILLYHLCSIEVFGVPYLSPFVGNDEKQLQDTLVRFPMFLHKKRPIAFKTANEKRQK